MIWQDMTCPALDNTSATPDHTFPLDLMVNYLGGYQPNAVVHNAYVLLLLMASYGGLRKLSPTRRRFIISRGGYAGQPLVFFVSRRLFTRAPRVITAG